MNRSNAEIFRQYDTELKLKIRSARNLKLARSLLDWFRSYLRNRKPTTGLAKEFLSHYDHLAVRSLTKYASTIKEFMNWYGEPLDDLKIKIPRRVPAYIEDSDIEKLVSAVAGKRSYKKNIARDKLLVDLALKTGMRRGEIANLVAGDIHKGFLIVRKSKGGHDRLIPLLPDVARRLNKFVTGKKVADSVFNLGGPTISNKIRQWAEKVGIKLNAHSLRHEFATN